MIPQLTSLSDEQVLIHDDYTSLVEILWPVVRDKSTIDSTMTTQLENLTARESRPGSLARNVLVANNFIDYNEPLILSDNLKCGLVIPRKPNTPKLNKNRLSVFPNPSKDYIIVYYDLEGREGKSTIVIHPIDGRPYYQQPLPNSKNQFVINTANFPSGMYSIYLENAGEILETVKFIISQ